MSTELTPSMRRSVLIAALRDEALWPPGFASRSASPRAGGRVLKFDPEKYARLATAYDPDPLEPFPPDDRDLFVCDPQPGPMPRPRLSQWWIVLAWMTVALAAGTAIGIAIP